MNQRNEGTHCNGNCGQGDWCDCDLGAAPGDWITEYPLASAIAAVAVLVLSIIGSAAYPWGWF